LRDEGVAKLAFIDLGNSANNWFAPLDREYIPGGSEPQGRDMQLVGGCRVLVGTALGYDEYDLRTGLRVAEITSFPGTLSAYRLRNKNTMLVGVGTEGSRWLGQVGIVLVQVDSAGGVVGMVTYSGTYARLVRETAQGTYLIANNQRIVEGDQAGNLLAQTFTLSTTTQPHAWLGLRVNTATPGVYETIVASGNSANLSIFQGDGTIRKTITGGTALVSGVAVPVNPNFFAGFQVLPNGNYLVVNYSAQGPGHFTETMPILEYNPSGALIWYWRDPVYQNDLSGIRAAIVLDGLDPTKLQIEGVDGKLASVN
jgi:hypothetical protein